MRRTVLILTTMAVALVMAGGVAMAVSKQCPAGSTEQDPCKGTKKNDALFGRSGTDFIKGLAGNDVIVGSGGADTTDGGSGSDRYFYRDGFGIDTLKDSSGIDTVNFSEVGSGMGIDLVPEAGPENNKAVGGGNRVEFGSSAIERAVGTSGDDFITGGKEDNTLMPGPGSGIEGDTLTDLGGIPGGGPFPALPASDDTYKGFESGRIFVRDFGGAADKVDLSPLTSDEVSFDVGPSGDSLLIFTSTGPERIEIVGYFSPQGRIEKIILADFTLSSADQARVLAEASAHGNLPETIEKLKDEAKKRLDRS